MMGELRVEYEGEPLRRVRIENRPLVVGSAPGADIRLSDGRMSHRHCRVEVADGGLLITDLGSAQGTYVRGQRITRRVIAPGEVFMVGGACITFDLPATADDRASTEASGKPVPGGGLAETVTAPARAPLPTLAGQKPAKAASVEGYEILERLGEGSMGTTYRARSVETGTPCALKLCDFRNRSQAAVFFVREVQMGLKLRHPNLVPVLDFGESGGLLFLAMEFVEGGSLHDRIRRGPLAPSEAVSHLVQLAGALDYASSRKFIHRDIKPANILLTADGVPKLGDFGIAKLLADRRNATLTRTGDARGTPLYMAPEVIVGARDADARADLYSLGATYYHALAGEPPFWSDTLGETLRMVSECEPARLEGRAPSVPTSLAEVIRRLMRKEPTLRYQTASELATDLKQLGVAAGGQGVG